MQVGGLVGRRHNDQRDEAGALCAMATTESRVSYEPMIYYGTGVTAGQRGDAEVTAESNGDLGNEARGDVAVHGLFKRDQTTILDICVMDTDANSYKQTASDKVLEKAAKRKKDKYLDACLERRRTFVPLIYSVDGMACKEARAWEKRVASLLASKMDRPYSEMCGFVRSRMSLAIVRSNTLLLRGQRAHRALRPVLEDGSSFTALGRARGW